MIMPTSNVFITRLHIRYNRHNFSEDLRFQATANNQFFQGRYVINHPFRETTSCQTNYLQEVKSRQEQEAQNLAKLTGWNIEEIRQKIDFVEVKTQINPWWRKLWN
jgi:hypothetical protein